MTASIGKRALGITGAILLAAVAFRFHVAESVRKATAALEALNAQHLVLQDEWRRAETRRAEAESALADQPVAKTGQSRGITTSSTTAPPASAPRSQSELISTDPKLEILSLKWSRAVVGLEYGQFYRAMNLSPDQIEKFEADYLRHEERQMDLSAIARSRDAAGKKTIATLQQQAKDEYEAAQIEILGHHGYQQLQEYIRTLPVRNVVVLNLASAAALEGIAISAEQGDQLWRAALQSASNPKAFGQDILRTIDWNVLDQAAQRILAPAQFSLLKNVAPPSGFSPATRYQLEAAVLNALKTEAETFPPRPQVH